MPGDPIIRSMLADRAGGSIYASQFSDPGKAARANQIARQLGIPADLVESDLDAMLAEERLRRARDEARRNEAYARMMANQRLAAAAIDDKALPKVAQRTQDYVDWMSPAFIGMAATNVVGGAIADFTGWTSSYVQGIGEAVTQDRRRQPGVLGKIPDPFEVLGPIGQSLGWLPKKIRPYVTPRTGERNRDDVLAGFRSAGSSLAALAVTALTRRPAVGASSIGVMAGGQSYEDAREQGLSPQAALTYGSIDAVIEAGTEFAGQKIFGNVIKRGGKGALKALGLDIAAEVPMEQVATVGQELNRWAFIERPQGKTFAEFAGELPDEMRSTLVGTVVTAGVLSGASAAAGRVINRYADQQNADRIDRIMESAAASETRTANPADFEEALNQLVGESGADRVFIPAAKVQELFGEDSDRRVADDPFWSQYAQQIEEAVAVGGDVVIPFASAATYLAGSSDWQMLRDHVRTRAGGASRAELKDANPAELEGLAAEVAARLDKKVPLLAAERTVADFAAKLGYEGEQAQAITRMLATAMNRALAVENAKRTARGEAPLAVEEFASSYLPQAVKTTQAEYDAGQIEPMREAAQPVDEVDSDNTEQRLTAIAEASDFPIEQLRDNFEGWRQRDGDQAALQLLEEKERELGLGGGPQRRRRPLETAEVYVMPSGWPTGGFHAFNSEGRLLYRKDWKPGDQPPRFKTEAAARKAAPKLIPMGDPRIQFSEGLPSGETLSDTLRRGNISIQRDSDSLMTGAIIRAFEAADFSTAVHELGHFFLEDVRRRALRPDATDQEKADWQTFKDWALDDLDGLPVADDQTVPTEAHEFWARGFERYVYEGQAPAAGLKALFVRMRAFMLELYRSVKAFNAPITPEIREVMDRLLASDDEIENQRRQMRVAEGALADLMSEGEREAYIRLGIDARESARDRLFESVLSAIKGERARGARDRRREIKAEVEAEVDAQPVFRVLKLLRSGIPTEDGATRVTLSREWLVEAYGEEIIGQLPKGVPPIVDDRHAMDAEDIATLSGHENADAMIRAMVAQEEARIEARESGDKRSPRKAAIDDETEARFREEVGDPFENLEEEAAAAVANERQADRLSMELRALGRKSGRKPTAWKLATEWAKGHVRAQASRDAVSGTALQMYARNAAKAGQRVEDALLAQDYEEAFNAKQQQLLNMALLQEARRAKDEVETAVRRMDKLARRATVPSIDQDYLDQAHQLLETVDLRDRSQAAVDKRQAFAAWHRQQVDSGVEPLVPPEYRETLGQTHWSRLSIEELLELDAAVRQVVELGRLQQQLRDGKKARDYNEGVAELQDRGGQQPPRKTGKTTDDRKSLGGRARSILRSVDAAMIKTEQLMLWMDGGDPNGPWTRLLFNPMAEAQGRETDLLRAYIGDINALIKDMSRAQARSLTRTVDTPELIITNPRHLEAGQPFRGTKDQILVMALNWGNAGNRQRLLDGYGWNEQALLDVFNRTLTKEDWDFVQGVWDTVAKLWPQVEALERRVNGVAPEKVEAAEIETPFGIYQGGYFPAIYDPTQSSRAEQNEADRLSPRGGWHMATTRASATRARAEAVKGRPLLLNMAVITRHLGEVIHDITHREAVQQVKKLLSDPRVHSEISNRLGPEYAKAMGGWVENIATPGVAYSKDHPALVWLGRHLNKGVSLVGLGFRFTTMLKQLLGFSPVIAEIGEGHYQTAMRIVIAHPVQSYNEVVSRSAEMRGRFSTLDAVIDDMITEAATGKLSTIGPKGLSKYAFQGIAYLDMVVTTVAWTGAFNKGLAGGMNEDEAGLYADKVVRTTQGAGGQKDRSSIINAHPLVRSFYPFFSYLNALYNMQRDVARRFRHAETVGDYAEAARRGWWIVVVPVLVEAALFGEGPEDEDGDGEVDGADWARWFGMSAAIGNLGSIPLIGNLASAIGNGYTYRSSAYQQVGEGLVRGYNEGADALAGESELKGSTIKSVLVTLGLITARPTGQIGSTAQGVYDYATGEAEPEDAGDWYELLVKGRVSEEPTSIERMAGETG